MHIVTDENGNPCTHGHHEHTHTHTYEHSHEHSHMDGHEEEHQHSHEGHCHNHGEGGHCHSHGEEGHCHGHAGHCHGQENESGGDKTSALLKYMLDHNTHHASELDQMAGKLAAGGHEKVAEQIRKAVDEFQKGNMYLGLALSLVKES
ncbi:MAG: cobalt transporter [Eubacteriales bacterium]|nr:cobalt transporter [Eubacteriales bacterium]